MSICGVTCHFFLTPGNKQICAFLKMSNLSFNLKSIVCNHQQVQLLSCQDNGVLFIVMSFAATEAYMSSANPLALHII